jgi:hypothetical protein
VFEISIVQLLAYNKLTSSSAPDLYGVSTFGGEFQHGSFLVD